MKEELLPNEKRYVLEIMEILKSRGVNFTYREDAKEQLVAHILEARLNNEDFKDILGTPEEFAMHFMDTAITDEEKAVTKMNTKQSTNQEKRAFSIKGFLLFLLLSSVFYLGLQFLSVLTFTTVLVPEYGMDFHLFKISDYLWWNIGVILVNIVIALLVSMIAMYLLGKRYRLS